MEVKTEQEQDGGARKVRKIIAKKSMSDEEFEKKYANKFVTRDMIDTIIDYDADVYTEDGNLLLRFRKNALNKQHVQDFYDNVIDFAHNVTGNRGSTTGSKTKSVYNNPRVMSNIFGYFDRFAPVHKVSFKKAGRTPLEVRPCRFNTEYPEKYKKCIPMIQDVDKLYKKYVPEAYAKQNRKAKQTHFKIPGTCFTTVTTNVNFQTSIHTDRGDDPEGFGNLVVIEKGKYEHGETCFPQYRLGVNLRTNGILYADVHKYHGNLPIKKIDKDAERLSVVCYLREKLWLRTKNKSRKFFENHNKTFRKLTRQDKK